MRRRTMLAAAIALCGVQACARGSAAPIYASTGCQRVALVNGVTGAPVVGAEDMALDPDRRRLIVSAYDRRAVERAARRGEPSVPEGGLYAIRLDDLVGEQGAPVTAAPLIGERTINGGLRPHGLDLEAISGTIAFINRAYVKEGMRWRMEPHLVRVSHDGAVAPIAPSLPCHANDVLSDRDGAVVSVDHDACGAGAVREDVFGLARSGIVNEAGATLFGKARFANGLARLADGSVLLAATRDRSILRLVAGDGVLVQADRIAVPGGPDNLSVTPAGEVVAAVHPSLLRLALDRKLGLGRAPSRIVRADVTKGRATLLFDDPTGRVFSAATVAVEVEGRLIAGSVTDQGLLVCAFAGDAR